MSYQSYNRSIRQHNQTLNKNFIHYGSGLNINNVDDHGQTFNSNSSLLKNNIYHAASGGVVTRGGGASTSDSHENRRLNLLSAKTRATPHEITNEKRYSAVSQSLACVNFKNINKKLAP